MREGVPWVSDGGGRPLDPMQVFGVDCESLYCICVFVLYCKCTVR